MNKPGHASELDVQDKWPHHNPQFRDVAEYLRERRRCQRVRVTQASLPDSSSGHLVCEIGRLEACVTTTDHRRPASSYSFLILPASLPPYQPLKRRMSPRRTAVTRASCSSGRSPSGAISTLKAFG